FCFEKNLLKNRYHGKKFKELVATFHDLEKNMKKRVVVPKKMNKSMSGMEKLFTSINRENLPPLLISQKTKFFAILKENFIELVPLQWIIFYIMHYMKFTPQKTLVGGNFFFLENPFEYAKKYLEKGCKEKGLSYDVENFATDDSGILRMLINDIDGDGCYDAIIDISGTQKIGESRFEPGNIVFSEEGYFKFLKSLCFLKDFLINFLKFLQKKFKVKGFREDDLLVLNVIKKIEELRRTFVSEELVKKFHQKELSAQMVDGFRDALELEVNEKIRATKYQGTNRNGLPSFKRCAKNREENLLFARKEVNDRALEVENFLQDRKLLNLKDGKKCRRISKEHCLPAFKHLASKRRSEHRQQSGILSVSKAKICVGQELDFYKKRRELEDSGKRIASKKKSFKSFKNLAKQRNQDYQIFLEQQSELEKDMLKDIVLVKGRLSGDENNLRENDVRGLTGLNVCLFERVNNYTDFIDSVEYRDLPDLELEDEDADMPDLDEVDFGD
ncbi:MAG: hypothetical protein V1855_05355, partial [bacterium]